MVEHFYNMSSLQCRICTAGCFSILFCKQEDENAISDI